MAHWLKEYGADNDDVLKSRAAERQPYLEQFGFGR